MRRHVYYYTQLDAPYADLARRLELDPGMWLPEPAEPNRNGWKVRLLAEGVVPAPLGSRLAHVDVGAPRHPGPQRILRVVTWRADSGEALAPIMDADLELAELPNIGSQLSFMGTYRPPMSVVGQAGDRLVGYRVAEACVRSFVLSVGERLDASVTGPRLPM